MEQMRRGISGSTLKMIAMASMLIDHTGAIILERELVKRSSLGIPADTYENFKQLYQFDMVLRQIGRIAFPLFCFLLIVGFCNTKNLKKYIGGMLIFAAVSELPFDLAFKGRPVDFGYQNVFFTLLVGLLVLTGLRYIENRERWNQIMKLSSALIILGAGMLGALMLHTDYGAFGILTIVIMYQFRNYKILCVAVGCAVLTIMNMNEAVSFLSLIPIWLYNGKRGLSLKYFFYAFYPVHILILFILAALLGLGEVQM